MRPLSRPIRLLAEVLLIIGLSEAVVMGVMPLLAPGLPALQESLLDVALLVLLAAPSLYWRCMAFTRAMHAPTPHGAATPRGHFTFRQAVALTGLIQALGLGVTAAGMYFLYRGLEAEATVAFTHDTERLETEIHRRFAPTLFGLGGLRATLSTAQASHAPVPLPREAFAAHVNAYNMRAEFPGVRGFGFIERVARKEGAAYEQRMQADGARQYRIRTAGDAPDLLVIRNIEPLAHNRAALGFDIGQEAVRREGAERAIASGEATLTGKITLVQDQNKTPGFLLYLPVYREGQAPYLPDLRPANLLGLLYAPIVAQELLLTTRASTQSRLDFALYEGNDTTDAARVYSDQLPPPPGATVAPPPQRSDRRVLRVGGKLLTLVSHSTPAFDALQDRSSLAIAGVGGALLSLVAALATWLLAAGQLRAQNLAARMTQDLDRLARVVQHTHNAVTITDAAGIIEWVNAGFTHILGPSAEQALGSSLLAYISMDSDMQDTLRLVLRQVQAGTTARVELRLHTQDGRQVWLDTEIQPIQDADGAIKGFMEIATDITAQKQAQLQMEAAMRETSTLLAAFQSHAIVSATDRQGTITEANNAFCEISGYRREELIGSNHRIVNSGEHPPAFWAKIWADIASGQSWRGDVCNRAKDGHLYWVDSIIAPFMGDDGLVERYVSIRNDITPRKTAELQLQQVSERMALAVEGSSDGLWDWMNVDAQAQWWSPSYYALIGYTPQELPATADNFLSLLHPTSVEACKAATAEAIQALALFDLELMLQTKHQGDRWFRTRAKVWRDPISGAVRMAGSTQDIHDRVLAQLSLAYTNERFSLATESAGIGMWEWHVDEKLLQWDAQMYALYGRSPDCGESALTVLATSIHSQDRPAVEAEFGNCILQRRDYGGEYRIIWPTGAVHHIRAAGRVVLSADGKRVHKLIGVNFDVTDIKSTQQALTASEAFLDRVGRVAGVGGWRVDLADQHITWTALTKQIHEVPPDYVPQLDSAIAFYAPEARPTIEAAVQQGISQGTPWDLELPFLTANGRSIWVRAVGEAEFVDGQPVALVGAFQDITRRREQEQALRDALQRAEQASLAKGQFLANMSHEIRTPMNAIIGMLKLLHHTPLTTQQLDYADKSQGAAVALLGLINDILDFSKIEAGKMTLDPQPLQLDKLLRDLAVILGVNVQHKEVEVLYDIDPELPDTVLCDGMRLQQVLINLGGNAVKFTQQGQVVVSVRVQERSSASTRLEFSVKDSGIGIAPENQARIFAGFSQAEASTTRKFGGTGLGLAISQRLVELMGGTLQLHSVLGEGSTFAFTLTLASDAQASHAPPMGYGAPRRTLIIDDNPVSLGLMTRMVRAWGWSVHATDNGMAALGLVQQAQAQRFDVIVVDWVMPELDGWDTVAHLHAAYAARGWEPAHTVMVSSHGRDMLAQRTAAEQGTINAYVVKPLTASMLFDATLQQPEAAALRDPQRGPSSARRLRGMRVLVVEDNLINQQVAEELLSSEGARISLAANGQLGVEAVAAAQPQFDAVLMDLQMPVMDGYTATRAIRHTLGLQALPIIAMTANAMASDREECLAAGMNEHVGKPFDLDQLVHTLLQVSHYHPPLLEEAKPKHNNAESTQRLTDLPGLEVGAAVARMGGLQSLYLKAAHDFQAALPAVLPQLNQSMARDTALATMQLHTLKGNAGTVGATALANAAAALEALLKSDTQPTAVWAQALQTLDHCVHDTLQTLAQLLTTVAMSPAPGTPPDTAPWRAVLQTLAPRLVAEDFSVLESWAQHRDTLETLPPAALAELEAALQALEFSHAARLCQALLDGAIPS